MNKFAVITTVNGKTKSIRRLEETDCHVIVVGDQKTPPMASNDGFTYLSVQDQKKLNYRISKHLPYNHYSRKNIGYLYAIDNGADVIFDTDDDNTISKDWRVFDFKSHTNISCDSKYCNIYTLFAEEHVWPRGLPLDEVLNKPEISRINGCIDIGVWQGLVDGDPDVDAIYRLTSGKTVKFGSARIGRELFDRIGLVRGTFCPFNSQNTIWEKRAFKYMYLPISVTFRSTDIIRGYVAQQLMWNEGLHVGFTASTAYQIRNEHDLMDDFASELPLYKDIKRIVDIISKQHSIIDVYADLYSSGIVSNDDLVAVKMWSDHFED